MRYTVNKYRSSVAQKLVKSTFRLAILYHSINTSRHIQNSTRTGGDTQLPPNSNRMLSKLKLSTSKSYWGLSVMVVPKYNLSENMLIHNADEEYMINFAFKFLMLPLMKKGKSTEQVMC